MKTITPTTRALPGYRFARRLCGLVASIWSGAISAAKIETRARAMKISQKPMLMETLRWKPFSG